MEEIFSFKKGRVKCKAGFWEKKVKPAAHESYLLSKNSLVTIGVKVFVHTCQVKMAL